MIESSTPASNSNATEELFHTNLLRLQADQLLSESLLPLCSQTGFLDKEVKWSKDVQRYLEGVQNIVRKMDAADLSPDNVRMNDRAKKDGGGDGGPTEKLSEQKFWVELHSDKAKRHLEAANNCGDGGPEKWIFHFPGGHHLQMSSINSYAAFGAGLTTATANANVIPTVDLAVLLPVKNRSDDEDDSEAMISGKDYMSGRYFDVSLFCIESSHEYGFQSLISFVNWLISFEHANMIETKHSRSTFSQISISKEATEGHRISACCK